MTRYWPKVLPSTSEVNRPEAEQSLNAGSGVPGSAGSGVRVRTGTSNPGTAEPRNPDCLLGREAVEQPVAAGPYRFCWLQPFEACAEFHDVGFVPPPWPIVMPDHRAAGGVARPVAARWIAGGEPALEIRARQDVVADSACRRGRSPRRPSRSASSPSRAGSCRCADRPRSRRPARPSRCATDPRRCDRAR